jgi:SRSO17 transposase
MTIDVTTLQSVRTALDEFVARFDDCIKTRPSRAHVRTFVGGQLSGLERKSIEPIALAAGVAPRTLQEFLAVNRWDHHAVGDRLQQIVAEDHTDPHAVAVVDDTGMPKRGRHTPGVQRQYCGQLGKTENCVVAVGLGFATTDFHCLLDLEPYLPATTWAADRERCRAAGIPDAVVHRPKWQMALEQLDRAHANGVRVRWLVADEGYGSVPAFRDGVGERGLAWIVEVPRTLRVWTTEPQLVTPAWSGRGRPPSVPRLAADSPPPTEVHELATADAAKRLRDPAWTSYRVKDTDTGPQVWDVRAQRVWVARGGRPESPKWLLIAVHPLNEIRKYFLADAPANTSVAAMLEVAFGRWHIERCFRDGKQEIGLNHFEVRTWTGLERHLILSMLSLLFLNRETTRLRAETHAPFLEH